MILRNALIAAMMTMTATTATQAQNIGGNFENWDSVGNEFFKNYSPAGWLDINNRVCELEGKPWAVTRSTDAHSGSYAIQLKNIALSYEDPATIMTSSGNDSIMINKIPVTARYPRFEGYYKYSTPEKDTFEIMVIMMKGEEYLGVGEFKQSANTTDYLKFSMSILYMTAASKIPDSAIVMIKAGSSDHFVAGSTLLLDDLAFNFSQGLNNLHELDAEVSIWPNPAADETNITLKGNLNGKVKIELIDLLGKTLKTVEYDAAREMQTPVSLAGMPQGVLFIRISDDNGSKGFRIVHQ